MITGFSVWCQTASRRTTAYLICSFNGHDGAPSEFQPRCLSLHFDLGGPLVDSDKFDEPWINVEVPAFKGAEVRKADAWLKRYAAGVERRFMKSGDRPVPHECVKAAE